MAITVSETWPDERTHVATAMDLPGSYEEHAIQRAVLAAVNPLLAALPPPRERSVEWDEAASTVRFVSHF